MATLNNLPRLLTRAQIAEFFGMDRRRQAFKHLRAIAIVNIGGKDTELYEAVSFRLSRLTPEAIRLSKASQN